LLLLVVVLWYRSDGLLLGEGEGAAATPWFTPARVEAPRKCGTARRDVVVRMEFTKVIVVDVRLEQARNESEEDDR
jgi:hypothetical protein